jgi:hypothetical protein
MKKTWYASFLAISMFMVLFLSPVSSHAVANLNCSPVNGTPPGIDGVYNLSEWPATPQITITTPIQTKFYCMNDSTDLYILVDALGDVTNNNAGGVNGTCSSGNIQACDECLLVFRDATDTTSTAEVWGMTGNIIGSHLPTDTQVSIGFDGHRFYEWKIPLVSINAIPGQALSFSSPRICKSVGDGGQFCSSMPYDGYDKRDNEWPAGVIYDDKSTWTQLRFNDPLAIPTLTEWGMIIFMVFAGVGAVYFMRRQRRAAK